MLVSDIVRLLPASLDWMVLFDLGSLRPLFDDLTIKRMFFIPEGMATDSFSHAILTEEGTILAPILWEDDGPARLTRARDGKLCPSLAGQPALLDRFSSQASIFPMDEANCLGLGEIPGFFPPVLLHIRIEGSCGRAKAVFSQEPTRLHYELLSAVGVQYHSGEWRQPSGGGAAQFVAEFTVDLQSHIFAGLLSGFSKTGYCNAFFLQQGTVGSTLEAGLSGAALDRIRWAWATGYQAACRLAEQALAAPLPMLCQPPPPKPAFDFGDLVPLGLLARCLDAVPPSVEDGKIPASDQLAQKLKDHLLEKRNGELWPFQSGDIPTATDSSLVLLGLFDPRAIEALERFSDGEGGYYPQLWSDQPGGDAMLVEKWNEHWCQPDYATTCLVRHFRRTAGMPDLTPLGLLENSFDERGGLFFANPYLVDWALALALQGDESPAAGRLRARLISEIVASLNSDHTFGTFDIPLSTALAILSLEALGFQDRLLLIARMRLAQLMQPEGKWPASIPYYSTFKLPDSLALFYSFSSSDDPSLQIARVSHQPAISDSSAESTFFAFSFYIDRYNIVTTSAATLALAGGLDAKQESVQGHYSGQGVSPEHSHPPTPHGRYRCASQMEYLARFVLPHYAREASAIVA
jgi:hypothetical protein